MFRSFCSFVRTSLAADVSFLPFQLKSINKYKIVRLLYSIVDICIQMNDDIELNIGIEF